MKKRNSFIFLPDISGFTEFVSHTEVEHSRHIVAELLELLIDNEELGLTLAEIEGDALFYYKTESVPSPKALMDQVEKMYVNFHSHLKRYEDQRICDCGACQTATNLTLKFIAHAGPLDFIQIKDQRKPYGKEVITAHRLMKNTITIDDYLLLSEGVYNSWTESITTTLPTQLSESTYDLGVVQYQFFELTELQKKAKIPVREIITKPDIPPIASSEIIIDKDPFEVFEAITNFKYRLNWNKDLNEIEYDQNQINRVGSKHRCIVDGKLIDFETIYNSDNDGILTYSERTTDIPFLKPFITSFQVENQNGKSKVSAIGIVENRSFLISLLSPLLKNKIKAKLKNTLVGLKSYLELGYLTT